MYSFSGSLLSYRTHYLIERTVYRNKWVLNTTNVPLFFLLVQVIVAVVLFLVSDMLRLLPDRLSFDVEVCKGLVPMVALSVVGIRWVVSFPNILRRNLI